MTPSPNAGCSTSSPMRSPRSWASLGAGALRRPAASAASTTRSRWASRRRSSSSRRRRRGGGGTAAAAPQSDRGRRLWRPYAERPVMLPRDSTSSPGISSRNRDGGLYCVEPNRLRLHACVTYRRSLGPRDADVGEPALLLQLVGLGQRPGVREDPFLDADEEHDRELEALGRVQRHQHDLVVVGDVVGVGDERDLLQELVEPRELAGRADELAEVLDPPGRLDGVLGLQLGQVAAPVERGLQQVARPDVGRRRRRRRRRRAPPSRRARRAGRRTTRCRGRPGR